MSVDINVNLLICLIFSSIWVIIYCFYLNRILGFVATQIFRKLIFKKDIEINIQSVSISLLSGKLMFSDVSIKALDMSIQLINGFVIVKWWKPSIIDERVTLDHLIENVKNFSKISCNIYIYTRGLEVHFYNSHLKYQRIFDIYESILNPENYHAAVSIGNPIKQINPKLEMFYKLISAIYLEHDSAKFIFGNHLMQSLLVVTISHSYAYLSRILNKVSTNIRINTSFIRAKSISSFWHKNPKFEGESYRCPLTSGPTIQFFDISKAKIFLFEQPSITNNESYVKPQYIAEVRIEKNFKLIYGPWFNKQRESLQKFFNPPEFPLHTNSTISISPLNIFELKIELKLECKSSVDIIFMNDKNDIKTFSLCFENSFIFIPFISNMNELSISLKATKFSLKTNHFFDRMIESEELMTNINISYGLNYHDLQVYRIDFIFDKNAFYFIHQQINYIMALLNDWSVSGNVNLTHFVPVKYHLTIKINKLELITYTNECNWLNRLDDVDNNKIGAIADTVTINIDLDFTKFAAPLLSISVPVQLESIHLFLYIGDGDTLKCLYKKMSQQYISNCKNTYYRVIDVPTWISVGCVNFIDITIEYSYSPIYTISSYYTKLTNLPGYTSTPSESDELFIKISIGSISFYLYGILLENIIGGFINNYAGSNTFALDSTKSVKENLDAFEAYITSLMEASSMKINMTVLICDAFSYLPYHTNSYTPFATCDKIIFEVECHRGTYSARILFLPIFIEFPPSPKLEKNGAISIDGIVVVIENIFQNSQIESKPIEYASGFGVIIGKIDAAVDIFHLTAFISWLQQFSFGYLSNENHRKNILKAITCKHGFYCKSCPLAHPDPCVSSTPLLFKFKSIHFYPIKIMILHQTDLATLFQCNSLIYSNCSKHIKSSSEGSTIELDQTSVTILIPQSEQGNTWSIIFYFSTHSIIYTHFNHSFSNEFLSEQNSFIHHQDRINLKLLHLLKDSHNQSGLTTPARCCQTPNLLSINIYHPNFSSTDIPAYITSQLILNLLQLPNSQIFSKRVSLNSSGVFECICGLKKQLNAFIFTDWSDTTDITYHNRIYTSPPNPLYHRTLNLHIQHQFTHQICFTLHVKSNSTQIIPFVIPSNPDFTPIEPHFKNITNCHTLNIAESHLYITYEFLSHVETLTTSCIIAASLNHSHSCMILHMLTESYRLKIVSKQQEIETEPSINKVYPSSQIVANFGFVYFYFLISQNITPPHLITVNINPSIFEIYETKTKELIDLKDVRTYVRACISELKPNYHISARTEQISLNYYILEKFESTFSNIHRCIELIDHSCMFQSLMYAEVSSIFLACFDSSEIVLRFPHSCRPPKAKSSVGQNKGSLRRSFKFIYKLYDKTNSKGSDTSDVSELILRSSNRSKIAIKKIHFEISQHYSITDSDPLLSSKMSQIFSNLFNITEHLQDALIFFTQMVSHNQNCIISTISKYLPNLQSSLYSMSWLDYRKSYSNESNSLLTDPTFLIIHFLENSAVSHIQDSTLDESINLYSLMEYAPRFTLGYDNDKLAIVDLVNRMKIPDKSKYKTDKNLYSNLQLYFSIIFAATNNLGKLLENIFDFDFILRTNEIIVDFLPNSVDQSTIIRVEELSLFLSEISIINDKFSNFNKSTKLITNLKKIFISTTEKSLVQMIDIVLQFKHLLVKTPIKEASSVKISPKYKEQAISPHLLKIACFLGEINFIYLMNTVSISIQINYFLSNYQVNSTISSVKSSSNLTQDETNLLVYTEETIIKLFSSRYSLSEIQLKNCIALLNLSNISSPKYLINIKDLLFYFPTILADCYEDIRIALSAGSIIKTKLSSNQSIKRENIINYIGVHRLTHIELNFNILPSIKIKIEMNNLVASHLEYAHVCLYFSLPNYSLYVLYQDGFYNCIDLPPMRLDIKYVPEHEGVSNVLNVGLEFDQQDFLFGPHSINGIINVKFSLANDLNKLLETIISNTFSSDVLPNSQLFSKSRFKISLKIRFNGITFGLFSLTNKLIMLKIDDLKIHLLDEFVASDRPRQITIESNIKLAIQFGILSDAFAAHCTREDSDTINNIECFESQLMHTRANIDFGLKINDDESIKMLYITTFIINSFSTYIHFGATKQMVLIYLYIESIYRVFSGILGQITANSNFASIFQKYSSDKHSSKFDQIYAKFLIYSIKVAVPLYALNIPEPVIISHLCYSLENATLRISSRKRLFKGSFNNIVTQWFDCDNSSFPIESEFWDWQVSYQPINFIKIDSGFYHIAAKTNKLADYKSKWNVFVSLNVSGIKIKIDDTFGSKINMIIHHLKEIDLYQPKYCSDLGGRRHSSTVSNEPLAFTFGSFSDLNDDNIFNTSNMVDRLKNPAQSKTSEIIEKETLYTNQLIKNINKKISNSIKYFEAHNISKCSESFDNKSVKRESIILTSPGPILVEELLIYFSFKIDILKGAFIIIYKDNENSSTFYSSDTSLLKSTSTTPTITDDKNVQSLHFPIPDTCIEIYFTSNNLNPSTHLYEPLKPATVLTKLLVGEIPATYELSPNIMMFLAKFFDKIKYSSYQISQSTTANTNAIPEEKTDKMDFTLNNKVNVAMFVSIKSSRVLFNCLPKSKIEGAFNIPGFTALFTYRKILEDDLKTLIGDENIHLNPVKTDSTWNIFFTCKLTDFMVKLYHPYLKEGHIKNKISLISNISSHSNERFSSFAKPGISNSEPSLSKNLLLFNIDRICANIGRYSFCEYPLDNTPQVPGRQKSIPVSNSVTKTSLVCDFGVSSFNFDAKHAKDIETAINSWIARSQLIKMFMGENAAMKNNKDSDNTQPTPDVFWISQIIITLKFEKLVFSSSTGFTIGRILCVFSPQNINVCISMQTDKKLSLSFFYTCDGLSVSLIGGILSGNVTVGELFAQYQRYQPTEPIYNRIFINLSYIHFKFEHVGNVYLMISLQSLKLEFLDTLVFVADSTKNKRFMQHSLNILADWKSLHIIVNKSTISEMSASIFKLCQYFGTKKQQGLKTFNIIKSSFQIDSQHVDFAQYGIPKKIAGERQHTTLMRPVGENPSINSPSNVSVDTSSHNISDSLQNSNEYNWIKYFTNYVQILLGLNDELFHEDLTIFQQAFPPQISFQLKLRGEMATCCIFNGPNMCQTEWGLVILDSFSSHINQNYNFKPYTPYDVEKCYIYEQGCLISLGITSSENVDNICGLVCKIESSAQHPPSNSDSVITWLNYTHTFSLDYISRRISSKLLQSMKDSIKSFCPITFPSSWNDVITCSIKTYDSSVNKCYVILTLSPVTISAPSNHSVFFNQQSTQTNLHNINCSFVVDFAHYLQCTTDLNLLLFLNKLFKQNSISQVVITDDSKKPPDIIFTSAEHSNQVGFISKYNIRQYHLKPKVRFLIWDKTDMNAIDIQWILTNLGFTDAENTIPTAFHSQLLIHIDTLVNLISQYLLNNNATNLA